MKSPVRPKSRKRSRQFSPLATWRTDRKLKIIGVTRAAAVSIPGLPAVGKVVAKERTRTGFLQLSAHLRALRGKATTYVLALGQQTFEVVVAPRFGRGRKVIGVRGTLTQVSEPSKGNGHALPEIPDPPATRRQRNSFQSAVRSLELARTVADSSRKQAELRIQRATEQEQRAVQAQLRAEREERRARLLADASSELDQSVDRGDNLDRLAGLIVVRTADWCVIHVREGDRLRRLIVRHRYSEEIPRLERAFPEEEEGAFAARLIQGGSELFTSVVPEDFAAIVPTAERARALKEQPLQSMMRTPLKIAGRMSGLLTIGSEDPGRNYDILDHRMAQDLAHRLALSEETTRLFEEAQREIALRKEAEARLRVFNVDLERRISERTNLLEEAMREANNFAYTVAHDLRAPLRAITGFCQAFKEDYSGAVDGAGRDYLERIVSGARKMDDLIRDLLDYARLNRAEIKRHLVDLDQVVDDALLQLAVDLSERKAAVEVVRPLHRAIGYAPVLAQVFINLISNAAKFVSPGVRPAIRIRSERQDGRVRVLIEDNGIGIAPQHHERIFGIFERLNRAEEYPGTGIGLAIVRRAVERLSGKVGVESEPGKGSRFWVDLPSA